MYSDFLIETVMIHAVIILNQFIMDNFDEVCPAASAVKYKYKTGNCSVHCNEGLEDEGITLIAMKV